MYVYNVCMVGPGFKQVYHSCINSPLSLRLSQCIGFAIIQLDTEDHEACTSYICTCRWSHIEDHHIFMVDRRGQLLQASGLRLITFKIFKGSVRELPVDVFGESSQILKDWHFKVWSLVPC